jgi:hypothetical protein
MAVVRDAGRLLSFHSTRDEMERFGGAHLALGLGFTWLVGMGRWWDDPTASALQKSGVGSLAYVFALSLVLFVIALPLGPRAWSYRHVLTFVSLTSPPAALYAIPVEQWVSLEAATTLNLIFLLIVATWRIGLLVFYFLRYAALAWWKVIATTLLPLSGIVVGLTVLNLERGIIQIMGGLRDPTAEDDAAGVVAFLAFAGFFASVPLVLLYLAGIADTMRARRRVGE